MSARHQLWSNGLLNPSFHTVEFEDLLLDRLEYFSLPFLVLPCPLVLDHGTRRPLSRLQFVFLCIITVRAQGAMTSAFINEEIKNWKVYRSRGHGRVFYYPFWLWRRRFGFETHTLYFLLSIERGKGARITSTAADLLYSQVVGT